MSSVSIAEMTNCQCGIAKPTQKIVGGNETRINEYPWMVGMVKKGKKEVFCGGSLISNRWILSAAHCYQKKIRTATPSSVEALLGEHDYLDSSESRTIIAKISKIVNHPSYDDEKTDFDFSLLKTRIPINFLANPHVRPVCLP